MAAPFTQPLVMESANLFAGMTTAAGSQHLRLIDVKLPHMEEQMVDWNPGGSPVGIEMDVAIHRLQCDLSLAGWTPQVAELVYAWQNTQNHFWVYGALRDRLTGGIAKAEAHMYGLLSKADPMLWHRGALDHWAYSIRAIIKYRLAVIRGGQTDALYTWDFFNNVFSTADVA
jgi:phage tail tube protein FII